MEFLKKNILTAILGLLVVGLAAADLRAQDRAAAVEAFNTARDLAQQGNYEKAISQYNQARANAVALGEEGQDIVERIEDALPRVHFFQARSIFESNNPPSSVEQYDQIISAFSEAASVGEDYGDTEIQTKAAGVVTQMYNNKASYLIRQENYEEALTAVNVALERNPSYSNALYQKALALKNLQRPQEEVLAAYDKAIEVAEQQGNSQVQNSASESAANYLFAMGADHAMNDNYTQAIELLNGSPGTRAPGVADAYDRLAFTYNKRSDWQQGLDYARQALEYSTGGAADQAKIYYELGLAYKGMGNTEEACSAFRNALHGDFTDPARNQIEEQLECESSTGQ
ncbi:MAG: tetratricopeptide repeat protein [Balneolaceae bacterium]|nr:tetratricopeptide repeat protein [Balneolaceae bacterium]